MGAGARTEVEIKAGDARPASELAVRVVIWLDEMEGRSDPEGPGEGGGVLSLQVLVTS